MTNEIKEKIKAYYIGNDIDKVLDYVTNLQEENERLKELCDKYEEEHNTAFKLWKMNIEEIPTYEEKKELQVRIDKAIEYINKSIDNHMDWYNYIHGDEDGEVHNLDILLNILQGEQNE